MSKCIIILEKGEWGERGRDTQSGPGSRGLSSILRAIAQTRRLGSYWRCFMFIRFFLYTRWCKMDARIDEIPSQFIEPVQDLKCLVLGTVSDSLAPVH